MGQNMPDFGHILEIFQEMFFQQFFPLEKGKVRPFLGRLLCLQPFGGMVPAREAKRKHILSTQKTT